MSKLKKACIQKSNADGGRKVDRNAGTKSRRPASRVRGATNASRSGPGSKLGSMIALLRRSRGATMEELIKATGWQAHSIRGAISGVLKKKRSLTVSSTVEGDGARAYRIMS